MRILALSLGCLVLSAACLAQQPIWVQVKTKNSPPAREWQAMAYDFIRGRTVLFGGFIGNNRSNDTWEYDGKDWTLMKPKSAPPVASGHVMVFHAAQVRTLLLWNGTWTWDGNSWTQLKPKTSPPLRALSGMAYDSARRRTVLFGGIGAGNKLLNDTWEWNGTNWTQIKVTNSPGPHYSHAMAYDVARQRVVLFGGFTPGGQVSDTWEYDGKSWVKMSPNTKPRSRWSFGMAYDTARRRTVLFGGMVDNFIWEYDGRDWTKGIPLPQLRYRWGEELMVYDSKRSRMVLFGGRGHNQQQPLNETWEYTASPKLNGSPSTISIATGGTHTFGLHAGTPHAGRLYWVFGSITGTSPGVTLASLAGSVNIPLNPDFYTDTTIALANTALLTKTRGTLDASGKATASLNVPKITNNSAIGVKLYHAYLVYDAKSNFYMASNPVELMLVH